MKDKTLIEADILTIDFIDLNDYHRRFEVWAVLKGGILHRVFGWDDLASVQRTFEHHKRSPLKGQIGIGLVDTDCLEWVEYPW
jgi:hypothetical protein